MFAHTIFLAITRPKFSGPLALLGIAGLCWWALASYRLIRQLEEHAPTTMSFVDAVKSSKDGEVYVRFDDATLDCGKAVGGPFGTLFALSDAEGHVAAMAHLKACPASERLALEGVFLDPPFGLYGAVVERGWNVTPGHVAFFDEETTSSRASTRMGLSLAILLLLIGCFASGLVAERRPRERRPWRMRALGLGMLGGIAWFSYFAHEYVVFGVVPAWMFLTVAFACTSAFVMAPNHPYMQKVGRRLLPDE